MSNPLWKIRFANYKPIDLRDIESYCIKQNVNDTSPIREGEMNEEIEKEFKDMIVSELNDVLGGLVRYIAWSKGSKYFEDRDCEKLYERHLGNFGSYDPIKYNHQKVSRDPIKYKIIKYLNGNKKVFVNHFDNIEKWKEKLCFAKEDIFKYLSDSDKKEVKDYLILEKREKLSTVEFYLKNKTTVEWGTYKTKEEAEIVYNKVDDYFKKTFEHFYKNLDNQEIYSL